MMRYATKQSKRSNAEYQYGVYSGKSYCVHEGYLDDDDYEAWRGGSDIVPDWTPLHDKVLKSGVRIVIRTEWRR